MKIDLPQKIQSLKKRAVNIASLHRYQNMPETMRNVAIRLKFGARHEAVKQSTAVYFGGSVNANATPLLIQILNAASDS